MAQLDRDQALKLIEAYFDGVYQGDIDNIPLHKDVTFQGTMVPERIEGEENVRSFLADVSAAFDETDVIFVRDIIDGNFVVSEVELRLANGKVIPLCDVFEISEGQIKSVRPYFDPRPMIE
jgi:limonene-1,2-epoxide hydrolase